MDVSDPARGKYVVLQVVGIGFRYSLSSEGAQQASDSRVHVTPGVTSMAYDLHAI